MPHTSIKQIIRKPLRYLGRYLSQKKRETSFQRLLRLTDIFLVGHPKSGNTMLTFMLGVLLENNFNKKINISNLREFIPCIHSRDMDIGSYADFPDPRIFRNEGPLFPKLYPRTVYIVRDPRSVYVSYYHHCVHDTGDLNWKIEDFVEEMLTHGCIRRLEPYIVRWDQQVLQWLERSKRQPVMFVKYEEMVKDKRKILEDVIEFAGITCDKKDIDTALQRSTFDNMRKEEETYGAEPYSGTKGERGYFVRRGKIDGWKDELSQEISKRIENEFSEAMKKVGYL